MEIKMKMFCSACMLGLLGAGGVASARGDIAPDAPNSRWASKAEHELFASGFAASAAARNEDEKRALGLAMAPGVAKDIWRRSLGGNADLTDVGRDAAEGCVGGKPGWGLSKKRVTYFRSF